MIPRSDLIEDGKYIYSTLSWDGVEVRERIPLVIHKWSPERAEEHLASAAKRLHKKLEKKLMARAGLVFAPAAKPRDPALVARRRAADESRAAILVERLKKIHGLGDSIYAVAVSWSDRLKAIRSWIAAGKPEFAAEPATEEVG